ncbi:MAG: DUF1552 domain-containing protein [Verrucomicrobia bacterium]|nr:DUF1552 domain-containing protein [Verrucomicrobiota bacterium]
MNTNLFLNRNLAAERHASLNRRHFLRGLGACLALPSFESLRPSGVRADGLKSAAHLAAAKTGAPLRMAFVYFPNGAIQDTWWPGGEDKTFELNRTLQPLESVKDHIQILGELDCKGATPGPDGPGDHARASGSFLTGVRVKKTAGADIHANISIDQVAANQIGHLTRFPSLELTCDYVRKSGSCDSGYSCAYQYNLAWRSPTQPVAPEPNPRLVFERLFGAGAPGERNDNLKRRQQQQRSILDFVLDDAHALQRQLSSRDRQKLDDYLGSVREIEQRIQKAERLGEVPDPAVSTPAGIPETFAEYIQIMYDMMILAFQTDSTRIATFLLAYEGSNRTFKDELGFAEGHHYLTHHQRRQEMIEKVKEIDLWYARQFAKFLEKMERTKDLDGNSLLHNSMIVYGSGNADGNRHTHVNLPIVLAGAGGGTLTPGRFVKFGGVPITNLYLGMIDRLGVQGVERHGDSTGRVEGI